MEYCIGSEQAYVSYAPPCRLETIHSKCLTASQYLQVHAHYYNILLKSHDHILIMAVALMLDG